MRTHLVDLRNGRWRQALATFVTHSRSVRITDVTDSGRTSRAQILRHFTFEMLRL